MDLFPKDKQLPSFPIWTAEFGATYPYSEAAPLSLGEQVLQRYSGSYGVSLTGLSGDKLLSNLPSYAKRSGEHFPRWKVNFIRQNRELYERNSEWIEVWLPGIREFPASLQKLEWNCKGEYRDLSRYILQVRASGLRVKRPTAAPSLVAMTATQVPIIGWEGRYMTTLECARLQDLDCLRFLPNSSTKIYTALGNAVNAKLVELIAEALLPKPFNRLDAQQHENSIVCAY